MQLIDRRQPPQEVRRVTVDRSNSYGFKCGDLYLNSARGMCPYSELPCESCSLWLKEIPEIGDSVILYADGSAKLRRKEAPDVQEP